MDLVNPLEESVSDSLSSLFSRDFDTWEASLTLNIPIGNNTAQAEYVKSRLSKEQSTITYENTRLGAEVEVRQAARQILKIVDGNTLVVASSDFTHYGSRFGYRPFTRQVAGNIEALDRKAIDAILARPRDRMHGGRPRELLVRDVQRAGDPHIDSNSR